MPSIYTTPRCRQCNGQHTYDAQGQINHRIIRPTNGREEYYMSICRDCERVNNRARRATGSRVVPTITASPLGLNRKFGVEIECYLPGGRNGTAAANVQRGLPTGWRLKGDGSLGTGGCEIVSPPIKGEQGLTALKTVLDLLTENGATVNRSCGLHVHHDASDIGRNGLVAFARTWAANQGLIDFLVSPSRRGGANFYCKPLTTNELTRLGTWADGGTGLPTERYRTVNLHAFSKYGTVEIRQHQGTLSFRKIEGWIKLVQGLLDAVCGRNTNLPAAGNLQGLFRAAGVDEDTAAYFLGRALQFNAAPSMLGLAVAA
jgi:hypothetical protein